jgi:hypothetical protein
MATSQHIMCGECDAVREAEEQPTKHLVEAVRHVTAVLVRNEKQRHRNNRERGGRLLLLLLQPPLHDCEEGYFIFIVWSILGLWGRK